MAGGSYIGCGVNTAAALRGVGCTLPVEFWHLKGEVAAVSGLGTSFNGGEHYNGWALKPYAVKHSAFDEVLLLDAGLGIEADPTPLFDTPAYETGALFWNDRLAIRATAPVWTALDLKPRQMQSLDSGQVIIDKRKNGAALDKVVAINADGAKTHSLLYGDKDTWLMGWLATKSPFSVCPFLPHYSHDGSWVQSDWNGALLFTHHPTFSAGAANKPGLSGDTYMATGPVEARHEAGVAKPSAGGVAAAARKADTPPIEQRRDRHGRLFKRR